MPSAQPKPQPKAPAARKKARGADAKAGIAVALGSKPRRTGGDGVDRSGNLHEAAYQQLRLALMDGVLTPGQTFTIRTVARVFGTSPMPVRDALKRLVAERALEMKPNRSVVLPVMTRARFQEILQIRLHLESMVAARATARVTPAIISAMVKDHEEMCAAAAAGRAAEYLSANRRFHFRLYEAAETLVMLPVIETMWMQVGPHLNQMFGGQKRAIGVAEHHHSDLLRALRRRDEQAAAKAIWDDLSDAADVILAANRFEE